MALCELTVVAISSTAAGITPTSKGPVAVLVEGASKSSGSESVVIEMTD